MLKKDLQSKIFDQDREIFQLKQFVEIGDEKLEKQCQKTEKWIKKYKLLLKRRKK